MMSRNLDTNASTCYNQITALRLECSDHRGGNSPRVGARLSGAFLLEEPIKIDKQFAKTKETN